MEYLDNPAGRLLSLFTQARGRNQSAAATAGWAEIFDIPKDDSFALVAKFGEMTELAQQTRLRVSALEDDDPEVVLEDFVEVENTLVRCLQLAGQSMEWHLSGLQKAGLSSLRYSSSLLHRRAPEPTIDKDSRSRLEFALTELLEKVREAEDLTPQARDMLIAKLTDLLEAVRSVEMRGTGPVQMAAEAMFGTMRTRRGLWEQAAKSKVAVGLYGVLIAIDMALSLVANTQALTSGESRPEVTQIWIDTTHQQPPALPVGLSEIVDAELIDDDEGSQQRVED